MVFSRCNGRARLSRTECPGIHVGPFRGKLPIGREEAGNTGGCGAMAGLSSTAASMILTGRPDTVSPLKRMPRCMPRLPAWATGPMPRRGRCGPTVPLDRVGVRLCDHDPLCSGLVRGALAAADAAGHVMLMLETAASRRGKCRPCKRRSTGRGRHHLCCDAGARSVRAGDQHSGPGGDAQRHQCAVCDVGAARRVCGRATGGAASGGCRVA